MVPCGAATAAPPGQEVKTEEPLHGEDSPPTSSDYEGLSPKIEAEEESEDETVALSAYDEARAELGTPALDEPADTEVPTLADVDFCSACQWIGAPSTKDVCDNCFCRRTLTNAAEAQLDHPVFDQVREEIKTAQRAMEAAKGEHKGSRRVKLTPAPVPHDRGHVDTGALETRELEPAWLGRGVNLDGQQIGEARATRLSKKMALLLRHRTGKFWSCDSGGRVQYEEFVREVSKDERRPPSHADILYIISTNAKKRFKLWYEP